MEEYIHKLIEQVRCKKVRIYIESEMRGHIEEQIKTNLALGMEYGKAEKMAVLDMGDPVEVGISMDKIHRPRVAWGVLLCVGIISLFGLFLQRELAVKTGMEDFVFPSSSWVEISFRAFFRSIILGLIAMTVICFLDYTCIARYAKIIGIVIIGFGLVATFGIMGYSIHGVSSYIGFDGVTVSAAMMFYVPIYGAILYKYRNGGKLALIKSIAWLLPPVFISIGIPNMMVAYLIIVSMLIELTFAINKGWFKVKKAISVLGVWAISLAIPLIGSNIPVFGFDRNEVFSSVSDINRDNILAYIIGSYGMIAGVLVIAILASLVVFIIGAAFKQKNELGTVMGIGCGAIILLNTIINVLSVLGITPSVASFLPFFSDGVSNIVLCYSLVGLVLSIYKYKDVYPRHITYLNTTILNKNYLKPLHKMQL